MKPFLFYLILFSSSVFAQYTESHRNAAKQLLNEMNINKTIIQGTDIMFDSFSRNNPNFSQNEDLFRKYFSKYFTYEELEDSYVNIYCNEFTEDEIIKISEFYKTDVGEKLIEKIPSLYKKMAELGEMKVKEFLPELIKEIEKREYDSENTEKDFTG